jgi:hypothetical protein
MIGKRKADFHFSNYYPFNNIPVVFRRWLDAISFSKKLSPKVEIC